jgi:hypothetical protein
MRAVRWKPGVRALGAVLLFAGLGCSGITVRSGQPGQPIPGPDEGIGGRPPTERGAGPVNSSFPEGGSRRTICRTTPRPRGWLAVDYVEGGSLCGGATRQEPFPAVVIQDLAPFPEGTILAVCTGQTIPSPWQREPQDERMGAGVQCPRSPGDKRTSATVILIRRR